MLQGEEQLKPAWLEAVEKGFITNEMAQDHFEMAEALEEPWNYRPEIQFDVYNTLLDPDGNRKAAWDIMRHFQEHGRILTFATTETPREMLKKLREARHSNKPLAAVFSKLSPGWIRNIQIRADYNTPDKRLMEALFDDAPETGSQDAFVSYINPFDLTPVK